MNVYTLFTLFTALPTPTLLSASEQEQLQYHAQREFTRCHKMPNISPQHHNPIKPPKLPSFQNVLHFLPDPCTRPQIIVRVRAQS